METAMQSEATNFAMRKIRQLRHPRYSPANPNEPNPPPLKNIDDAFARDTNVGWNMALYKDK